MSRMSGPGTPPPESPRRRVEPRLVFVAVVLIGLVLYAVAQVILVRAGEDCASGDEVGGLGQLFLPGRGCPEDAGGR